MDFYTPATRSDYGMLMYCELARTSSSLEQIFNFFGIMICVSYFKEERFT